MFAVRTLEFRNDGRKKRYMLVGVLDDFNVTIDIDNEANKGKYDLWDCCPATYECFCIYYKEFGDQDYVTLYEKGGLCVSKEENDILRGMGKGISMGTGMVRSNSGGGEDMGEGIVIGTTGVAVKGASPPHWVWQMKILFLDTIGKNSTITV